MSQKKSIAQPDNIKLELNTDHINTILGALSNMPYVNVFQVIQEIQLQAMKQTSSTENGVGKKAVVQTS